MLILIRGAGDIASGIALRLHHAGFDIVMTDLPIPTAVRRTVAFSEAIRLGEYQVEDVRGLRADTIEQVKEILSRGDIAVMADPLIDKARLLKPRVIVDAILAKKNLGTKMEDAEIVIGVGPGFYAGKDCHAVIETKRGHTLGRVILEGEPIANTGIPGNIEGYTKERVLRSSSPGIFTSNHEIGDLVGKGDTVAIVTDLEGQTHPILAEIPGMIRGLLQDDIQVKAGMKCGDIDPRGAKAHYDMVSDKALAIGGGVLEAILRLTKPDL